MNRPRLRVLIVASEPEDARFAERVIEDHGDHPSRASDVTDALGRLAIERYDVALVSLSLPRGDGLALVHHVRALYPDVDVVVMMTPADMEDSAHAMALGVLSTVLSPLTGDALLVAIDRARERRVLAEERARLAAEGQSSRRRTATYARCAAFVAETAPLAVAQRVLDACVGEVASQAAAIYLPEWPGASHMPRAAFTGAEDATPEAFGDADVAELDPTQVVSVSGREAHVVLLGDADLVAVVRLGFDAVPDEAAVEGLEIVAALGTAAFAAAQKVEAIARAGIKDPETSAYTFAYFGDVAGREIDRALRHGRRFSLLTIALDGLADAWAHRGRAERLSLLRRAIDAVLESSRDSDVLARVEDDELYLLQPETGLLGALATRRRIREKLLAVEGVSESFDPVVGIAVYPSDGSDLGRLLRVARRRSERARAGVLRRLGLVEPPFWEALDRLLGSEDDAGLGRDGSVALHPELLAAQDDLGGARHAAMPTDLLPAVGAAIVRDATRHGVAGTVYVAGEVPLCDAVVRAAEEGAPAPLRTWVLGGPADIGGRLRLPIEDERLESRALLLTLTELGGYVLAARRLAPGLVLAYHSCDLYLTDQLVASLQSTYHLQPEVT